MGTFKSVNSWLKFALKEWRKTAQKRLCAREKDGRGRREGLAVRGVKEGEQHKRRHSSHDGGGRVRAAGRARGFSV